MDENGKWNGNGQFLVVGMVVDYSPGQEESVVSYESVLSAFSFCFI